MILGPVFLPFSRSFLRSVLCLRATKWLQQPQIFHCIQGRKKMKVEAIVIAVFLCVLSEKHPRPSLSLWSCLSGIQHLCTLASSTHCHPHYCCSHTPRICLLLDPTVRVWGSQGHAHSENTTPGKGRQQREWQKWTFAGKNFQSACSYLKECPAQSFLGKKK